MNPSANNLRRLPGAAPFALAIFLGAFLLFQVQLIEGKILLPWFGGAPAVWTTCMLFFQAILLAGYAYAHAATTHLRPRAQAAVHLALLALSVALIAALALRWPTPITAGPGWRPEDPDAPILRILELLGLTVGVPFLVLSATSPLLQAWFVRACPGASPYRLYALSNAGSLAGLLSYPFALEPILSLRMQAWAWCAGYLAFALACAGCAAVALRSSAPAPAGTPEHAGIPSPSGPTASAARRRNEGPPSMVTRLFWLGLAATGSVMLLAATNQICLDIAVVPFLWVLPLVIYLLTFILCFESDRFYRRGRWTAAFTACLALTTYILFQGEEAGILLQAIGHVSVLFAGCMVCHGELARSKPRPRHITSFYLTIALGGAAGGIFVAVLAPLLFLGLWEFQISLVGVTALAMITAGQDHASWLRGLFPRKATALRAAAALTAAAGIILAVQIIVGTARYHGLSRNFYGVLSLQPNPRGTPALALWHGRILHGYQVMVEPWRREPGCYYGRMSGIGLAIENHPRRTGEPVRLGVVGMGVATIASYARKGDSVRFYEINPQVLALSRGDAPTFTYIKECAGRAEVVMGDARLSLERELASGGPQGFDVLAVDAFSSDSVPVHLLTIEAFEVYRRHLRGPDGVIAFHITNRFLDLRPVILALAERSGLEAVVIQGKETHIASVSTWMLLGRPGGPLRHPAIAAAADRAATLPPAARLWTDDWSNLLGAISRGGAGLRQ